LGTLEEGMTDSNIHDEQNWPRMRLSIAGITVAVACDNSTLAAHLRQHYAHFAPSDNSPPLLVLYASIDPDFPPPHPYTYEIGYCHATHHLETPGSEGMIDIDRGIARQRLSTYRPASDVEYALRLIYGLLAVRADGLLFHSAGIVRHGHAFLFFGHSGSGKTTVSRLSSGDTVLNDDLVLLLPGEHTWTVHATPFWNMTQVGPPLPGSAPLGAMLRLVQARHVAVEAISQAHALAEVLSCVPGLVSDTTSSKRMLAIGMRLLQTAHVWRLHFLPDASFWSVVEPLAAPRIDASLQGPA
jgi:hypothetical protein